MKHDIGKMALLVFIDAYTLFAFICGAYGYYPHDTYVKIVVIGCPIIGTLVMIVGIFFSA